MGSSRIRGDAATYSDDANNYLDGGFAVQVRDPDSEQTMYALQLVNGAEFEFASQRRLYASAPANISATYIWATNGTSAEQVVGTIESPTTFGDVTYEVYTGLMVPGAIRVGPTQITSWTNLPNSLVRFTTAAEGSLSIRASTNVTLEIPYTTCGG